MKIAMFSTKRYSQTFFDQANEALGHEITYFELRLTVDTASLAHDYPAICVFVNDQADAKVLQLLKDGGTQLIALRCAGFNNVDLKAAAELGLKVVRVPSYSPYAVAEHTVGLMLALNRQFHRAYSRVREGNFELQGLLGFDFNGRTVGVVGTGKIGQIVARIMKGFGCEVLGFDPHPNEDFKQAGQYVSFDELLVRSNIITLHCPLTPKTYHLIDAEALDKMLPCTMLINTSRGALIDTQAVIDSLKSHKLAYLGLDVYEEEEDLFFEDLSGHVIQDDTFARLLTFPNVLITGHQAFFTTEALENIAATTLGSVSAFAEGRPLEYEVSAERLAH